MEGAGGEHGVRVPHLRGVPAAGRRFQLFSFRELPRSRVPSSGKNSGNVRVRVGRGARLDTATRASHVPVGDTSSPPPRDRVIPRIDRRLPTGRDGVVRGLPVHRSRRPERQRRGCEEASADGARQASGRHGLAPGEQSRAGEPRRQEVGGARPRQQALEGNLRPLERGRRPSYLVHRARSRRRRFAGPDPAAYQGRRGRGLVRMPPCDWHCVTGWSTLGLCFRGVPFSVLVDALSKDDDGKENNPAFIRDRVGAGSTSAPRTDTTPRCRGGRARRLPRGGARGKRRDAARGTRGSAAGVPFLYGWKMAKFLKEVHFLATDDDAPGARRGFWEKLGCHPRGRWAGGATVGAVPPPSCGTRWAGMTDLCGRRRRGSLGASHGVRRAVVGRDRVDVGDGPRLVARAQRTSRREG